MKKFLYVVYALFLVALVHHNCLALDLSKSDEDGRYPWDNTNVFEQIAVVNLDQDAFNMQLMGIFAATPFADQMIVPIELRPLTVSMLVGAVMEKSFSDEWEVIKGDRNPILAPILETLYSVILGDPHKAGEIAQNLSAIPLMMPDSGGSAVLEFKNKIYDRFLLDKGLKYALALPWKVGFWTDGDLVRVDVINPEAQVELFFSDLPEDEQRELLDIAKKVKSSLESSIIASLFALFPENAVSVTPLRLPPYIEGHGNNAFYMDIGDVSGALDIPSMLISPGAPFNDSLFEMENQMAQMAVGMDPEDPDHVMMVHPLLFQDYYAFDGMASFLTSAYQNMMDQTRWVARPDGIVLDDFMFLAAKTYPLSPIFNEHELGFYRQLLGQMFKMTFLRPRGGSVIEMENSSGQKVYLVEVGSPYYGQILLRLGAHRAPGTPCKVIAFNEAGRTRILAYDTRFMFENFFGDADPTHVVDWDGAFFWPDGLSLSQLAEEARTLYGGFLAAALKGLGMSAAYQTELSDEGMALLQQLNRMSQQQ